MSGKRIQQNKTENGPLAKNRKKDSKRPSTNICYICALPNDILEKIIGYIPYWHMQRLRKSCKRLLNVCDSLLLHDFEASIFHYSLKNPEGLEYVALMAIKEATWPYIFYGFGSTFCGTILRIIWKKNKFSPELDKIKSFLKHFYTMANNKCGKPNSQLSRLLYCITLLRLLKKFKTVRFTESKLLPNYWRYVVELRGPWVGILSSPKSAAEPHDPSKLLMMLCEIMISNSTNRAFKKVWGCDSEIFVFGNDASEKTELSKNPTTVFTLKINAPKKIVLLLKSCLDDEHVQLPEQLPRGEFMVSIDISCREAAKWGCCKVHQIEIGPKFDANFGDEHDESDDESPMRIISSQDVIVELI